MSASIGSTGISDASALAQALASSTAARQKLDTLTQQASSGLVAPTYGGLGATATVSLSLSPQVSHLQTWQDSIDAATGRMSVAQTALSQIGSIASTFYAQLDNLNGLDPSEVDSIAASARDALQQVAGLLDTQDGGVYVFAGEDTTNPPVPNPDQITGSGFFAQIQTAVSGLAANGASATAAATLAIAGSNAAGTTPFSTYLSQPAAALARPTVQTGAASSEPVGILASANGDVASTGSSTTGSYMRDVLRALATIGSLSSAQAGAGGFQSLVQDTRESLSGAITALNQDAGVLGNRQSALADTKSSLADTATALSGQVSATQDVDMAKTLSALSLAQTQLQSSYQVIASLQGLSLAKFL